MTQLASLDTDILFALKKVGYSPQAPRLKQPFTIKGQIDLFGITFYGPLWVIASVTYPKQWWEVVGSPVMHQMTMAIGGDFEITYDTGFDREGEYSLIVRVYAGPTISTEAGPVKTMTLPPFPAVATYEAKFTVSGEVPSEAKQYEAGQPSISPATIYEGSKVAISIPVTSKALATQTVVVSCTVTYGSIFPGPGRAIRTYTSTPTQMSPGQTQTFSFEHIEVAPDDGRRDIIFEATVGGVTKGYNHFDDAYSVQAMVTAFTFLQPTINGQTFAKVTPGAQITIICPVISKSSTSLTLKARIEIYQGSAWITPGDLIDQIPIPQFTIPPNTTANLKATITADSVVCPKDIRVFLLRLDDSEIGKSQLFANAYSVEKPTYNLSFAQPVVNGQLQPRGISPGDALSIVCPVTSAQTTSLTLTAHIDIFQETGIPQIQGALIQSFPISQFTIAPGQTLNLLVNTTADSVIKPKQIRVFLLKDGVEVANSQLFNNAYYVETPVVGFTLGQPSASPYIAQPGQAVAITCPVTSKSTKAQTVSILVEVKQAGFMWMAGPTIYEKKFTGISIAPNATYNATISHTATTGGPTDALNRAGRHIAVTVFTDSTVAPNTSPNNPNEFDNVFYVQVSAPPGQYTLALTKVPDLPEYSVTKSPDKTAYNAGETVVLTASPAAQFDHWEGAVTGTSPYTTIVMNANKSVLAVFKPAVPTAVTFWVYAAEPPYLFTASWYLYYLPEGGTQWIHDGQWHGIEDPILLRNVPPRGSFAVYCSSIFGGVSPQYSSPLFNFAEGGVYEFAIVPGIVRRRS